MPEEVIIVDENDNPIGIKERGKLAPTDIYRISGLWITNDKNEILLAQRAATKKKGPNQWGPAVAGTVEKGETYESNIRKEAQEEIQLTLDKITTGKKYFIEAPRASYFAQLFYLTLNRSAGSFILDPNEVAQLRWWTKEEIKEAMKNTPQIITLGTRHIIQEFIKENTL